MSAPESYPCNRCEGTGRGFQFAPDDFESCAECRGRGRVSRVRVAQSIVSSAIGLHRYGRVFARDPYLVAAAHAGDRGLLEPWRRAGWIVRARRELAGVAL